MPKILIIEDEAAIRRVLGKILSEENDTYKVQEAEDGLEGIEIALNTIPDLIISDVSMPFKTGIELCNYLKNDEKTSHIPIILLTAKVGNENEMIGLLVERMLI